MRLIGWRASDDRVEGLAFDETALLLYISIKPTPHIYLDTHKCGRGNSGEIRVRDPSIRIERDNVVEKRKMKSRTMTTKNK